MAVTCGPRVNFRDAFGEGFADGCGDRDYRLRHDRELPRTGDRRYPRGHARGVLRHDSAPRPIGWPQRPAAGLPRAGRHAARSGVDVVTIGTPSGAHLEPAVAAAARRKTRDRGETAGNHAQPLRPDHRGLPQGTASSCPRSSPHGFHESARLLKKADRPGPLRHAHDRRRRTSSGIAPSSITTAARGAAPGSSTAAGR